MSEIKRLLKKFKGRIVMAVNFAVENGESSDDISKMVKKTHDKIISKFEALQDELDNATNNK